MRPDDVLELVRAHDPAAIAPADAAGREALLRQILATPAPSASARPRRARRWRPALVVAVVALALTGAGFAAYGVYGLMTKDDVLSELDRIRRELPLPPGVTWSTPDLADDGTLYGQRMGVMLATIEAQCAWSSEWLAAHRAGDAARMRGAIDGLAVVRTHMPLHEPGTGEESGGWEASSLRAWDEWVSAAEHGEAEPLLQFLRANCEG